MYGKNSTIFSVEKSNSYTIRIGSIEYIKYMPAGAQCSSHWR